MLQVAILCVLILIAILIAPWLIGVIAALAAAYGLYMVVLFSICALLVILVTIWVFMTYPNRKEKPEPELIGTRKVCAECQAENGENSTKCANCGSKRLF